MRIDCTSMGRRDLPLEQVTSSVSGGDPWEGTCGQEDILQLCGRSLYNDSWSGRWLMKSKYYTGEKMHGDRDMYLRTFLTMVLKGFLLFYLHQN